MDIQEILQNASDLLSHSKVMKDRDRDTDRAFKALHAAVSRLLDAALLQQVEIKELKKVKTANGKH